MQKKKKKNLLKWVPVCEKFRKNRQFRRFFEGEKSLVIGRGFQSSGHTLRQKIIWIPSGPGSTGLFQRVKSDSVKRGEGQVSEMRRVVRG